MSSIALLALVLSFFLRTDEPSDPVAVFKTGDYNHAIPLLQETLAKNPKDAVMQADLLSALVYEGRAEEAANAADFDAQNFPQSPEILAARGEFAYYMGDMPAAERLYKSALTIKEETARASYGLSHLFQIGCMHRTARLLCMRAHTVDPDDALITKAFMSYLTREKLWEMKPAFMKAHPWFYDSARQQQATQMNSEIRDELKERKQFELDGPREEVTIPLILLNDGPRIRGVGLRISIGGKPLTVLLDTGASGLLLTQKAIDKAGLKHLDSVDVQGVGDSGGRGAFLAVSDTCSFGPLKFKTCVIGGTEGKKQIADEEDGLFSTALLSDYLIQIDFQRRTLHLIPLPERPPNPQGYDRQPLPREAGFTPAFRLANHLFVSTTVNGKVTGLFLLDTGAGITNIDSTFARLATKIHPENYMKVRGISGTVDKVFEANKGELQFARFRQDNMGLLAFDLNTQSGHQEVRMDGILGLPVLALFRLTLDYRNALVNFDYVLGPKRKSN